MGIELLCQSGETSDGLARDLNAAVSAPEPRAPRISFPFEDAQALFGDDLAIDVAPAALRQSLRYRVDSDGVELATAGCFLADGDWDAWLSGLEASRVTSEGREILDAALDFRQTARYRQLARGIDAGKVRQFHHSEFDSVAKLDVYFSNFVRMLNRSARFGVLRRPPPRHLGDNGHYAVGAERPLWLELSESNTGVAIAAGGSLLRIGPGKHRTAAAQLLGLPSIPCEVRMIHLGCLRPYLRRFPNDGAGAVRACIADARLKQVPMIEARQQATAQIADRRLRALAGDMEAVHPRFVFQRGNLPVSSGARMLCLAPPGAIRGLLRPRRPDGPFRQFIGRGNWADITTAFTGLRPGRKPADGDLATLDIWRDMAGQSGAALVLRDDAVPLVVAADGTLLLLGDGDSRLDAARQRGDALVFAEICAVHLDWLRGAMARHACGPLAALHRGLDELPVEHFPARQTGQDMQGDQ